MDDGYWESLLRDADNEVDAVSQWESGDALGSHEFNGAGPQVNGESRSIANAWATPEVADWQRAEEMLLSGEVFQVTISGYNRGGLLADVWSLQGFLPASHLVTAPVGSAPEARALVLAARVGEVLEVRVVEIDRSRCRLILSERLARQDGRSEVLLASLEVGQMCQGTVTNLCPFGAFVDLGGFEGLIHISELSWGRVESAGEVLSPGDRVDVVVLQTNFQERKVALSLKRLRPDPWQGVEERYRSGQSLEAIITNVVNFGAFARLETGLEGLIHVSELAEGEFTHPRNVVREGDRVRVWVLHVDGAKRRIALTMRSGEAVLRMRALTPAEY